MNRMDFTGLFSFFLSDFLPDFCWIFAGLTSKMIGPDIYRIYAKNYPAGFRPDRTNFEAGRTGPDAKNPSGSNSDLQYCFLASFVMFV
jgi:hypothetical protein